MAALQPILPLLEPALEQDWVRICVEDGNERAVLLVALVKSRTTLEEALAAMPAEHLEAIRAVVDVESSKPLSSLHALRSVERWGVRAKAMVAVRSRVAPAEREAYLAWQRDLVDQLFSQPGIVASYLLADDEHTEEIVHVAEYADAAGLAAGRRIRERDQRFLKDIERRRFIGRIAYARSRWDTLDPN